MLRSEVVVHTRPGGSVHMIEEVVHNSKFWQLIGFPRQEVKRYIHPLNDEDWYHAESRFKVRGEKLKWIKGIILDHAVAMAFFKGGV